MHSLWQRISVLVIACMVVMTTAFSDAIVPSLFPILREELSATTTQLGALYGVTQIISVFATLLFIPVSHVHFKAIFCLSGAFVTSGVILFLFSPPDSYPLRITARILWGLGQAPNYLWSEVIIVQWFTKHTGQFPSIEIALGIMSSCVLVGSVAGFSLTPLLVSHFQDNLKVAYALLALCVSPSLWCPIIYSFMLTTCVRMGPKKNQKKNFKSYAKMIEGLKHAFSSFRPEFWVTCVLSFLVWSFFYVFLAYQTDILFKMYNFSETAASYFSSSVFCFAIVTSPLTGVFLQRKGKIVSVLASACGGFFLGISLISFLPPQFHPVIGFSVIGASLGIFESSCNISVAAIIHGQELETEAFALISVVYSLGTFVFSIVMGKLHDVFHSYSIVYDCCLVVSGFGIILCGVIYWLNPNLQKIRNQTAPMWRAIAIITRKRHKVDRDAISDSFVLDVLAQERMALTEDKPYYGSVDVPGILLSLPPDFFSELADNSVSVYQPLPQSPTEAGVRVEQRDATAPVAQPSNLADCFKSAKDENTKPQEDSAVSGPCDALVNANSSESLGPQPIDLQYPEVHDPLIPDPNSNSLVLACAKQNNIDAEAFQTEWYNLRDLADASDPLVTLEFPVGQTRPIPQPNTEYYDSLHEEPLTPLDPILDADRIQTNTNSNITDSMDFYVAEWDRSNIENPDPSIPLEDDIEYTSMPILVNTTTKSNIDITNPDINQAYTIEPHPNTFPDHEAFGVHVPVEELWAQDPNVENHPLREADGS